MRLSLKWAGRRSLVSRSELNVDRPQPNLMDNSHTSPSSPNFWFLPSPVKRVPFPFASGQRCDSQGFKSNQGTSRLRGDSHESRLTTFRNPFWGSHPQVRYSLSAMALQRRSSRRQRAHSASWTIRLGNKVAWTRCELWGDGDRSLRDWRDPVTALTQGKNRL